MKLVTVDHRLIVKKSGSLAPKEREAVIKALRKLLDPGDSTIVRQLMIRTKKRKRDPKGLAFNKR